MHPLASGNFGVWPVSFSISLCSFLIRPCQFLACVPSICVYMCVCVCVCVLYLTLCDPMDCRLPGFSVHGIFQARILVQVTISFYRGSSLPRDLVSCTGRQIITTAPPGKPVPNICVYMYLVKNPPTMQETWVWYLDQEDPLKRGIAIHSSILAWKIPWTESLLGVYPMGSQRVGQNWVSNTSTCSRSYPSCLFPS